MFAVIAAVAAFALIVSEADARPKSSVGSRGSHTYSAPPSTATAPGRAAPIERSATQPARPGSNVATTGAAAGQAARPGGMFGGGMLGGLAAGFLGAGLLGMLMGHGFAGGLGGLASMFGLLLQIGIVVVVAMLVWRWWQGRSQPATAGGPSLRQGLGNESRPGGMNIGALGGLGGFGGSKPAEQPLEVKGEDFDKFEQLLGEVLTAYGNEDLNALRSRVTPEMLGYYSEELSRNASSGDINKITNVKLQQGDLAEAWREGEDEYATVAMRYSLDDKIVARDDGRLIEQLPSEATELWTFRRARGGNWILSAVQQTEQD
jgi:predicted lipid-binding transport protein (Tim44 family)